MSKFNDFKDLLIHTKLVSELHALFPDTYTIKDDGVYTVKKAQMSYELAEKAELIGIGEVGSDMESDPHTNEVYVLENDNFDFFGNKLIEFFDLADGNKAMVRRETLILISQHLGNTKTGVEIAKLLRKWGVMDSLIEYPNTKWRMVFSALCYYASSDKEEDRKLFKKIIAEMLHPLMYNGDKAVASAACDEFNKYLEYDGLFVASSLENKTFFEVYESLTPQDEAELERESEETMSKMLREEKEFLQKPESKEKISTLRQAYKTLMNVVEVFCENPSQPNPELNTIYCKTKTFISDYHAYFRYGNFKTHRRLPTPHIPFINLFSAERTYREKNKKLSWDSIRPEMFATYGEIEEVYNLANGSDVISTPTIQQTFNDASLLLTQIKEKNKKESAKKTMATPTIPIPITHKIEITKIPDLTVKNVEENVVVKNKKRITLPKFPPTDWNKVEIRFLDDHTIYIKADNKTVTADFEGLGFRNDKNGKPNTAWRLLQELSKNSGETKVIKSPIPDNIKQQKRALSDRLKAIFKNDTDPFHDFTEGNTYKIKMKLFPKTEEERKDKLGMSEHLEETMTSEYETGR